MRPVEVRVVVARFADRTNCIRAVYLETSFWAAFGAFVLRCSELLSARAALSASCRASLPFQIRIPSLSAISSRISAVSSSCGSPSSHSPASHVLGNSNSASLMRSTSSSSASCASAVSVPTVLLPSHSSEWPRAIRSSSSPRSPPSASMMPGASSSRTLGVGRARERCRRAPCAGYGPIGNDDGDVLTSCADFGSRTNRDLSPSGSHAPFRYRGRVRRFPRMLDDSDILAAFQRLISRRPSR